MNLLITGAFRHDEAQLEALRALGLNLFLLPMESDPLPCDPADIDMVICNGLFLYHDIRQFANLRYVQLTSAGLDRVPVDYIREHGITLHNARGVYSIPMAEWVIMRILENYKSLQIFGEQQKAHQWIKIRNLRELTGTSAAIIGAGNVGQEIAIRLRCFGAHITGFDIHENPIPNFDSVKLISRFDRSVQDFDIVILTAPLTEETHHLISREILENMKPQSMLINISRGGLVDQQALIDVLSTRKDISASLDVFESEPLSSDSPLWEMENITISPHNSFVGERNHERLFRVILNNITTFINRSDLN